MSGDDLKTLRTRYIGITVGNRNVPVPILYRKCLEGRLTAALKADSELFL